MLTKAQVKQCFKRAYQAIVSGRQGQSSVEYALVLFAFLSVALALALLWHAGRDGNLLRRVVAAASHLWGGGDVLGSTNDILLF
jgi:Flp pilus assembly protein TadG